MIHGRFVGVGWLAGLVIVTACAGVGCGSEPAFPFIAVVDASGAGQDALDSGPGDVDAGDVAEDDVAEGDVANADIGADSPTDEAEPDAVDAFVDTAPGDADGRDAGGGEDTPPDWCASGVSCIRTSDCAGSGLDFPQCLDGCCVGGDAPTLPCSAPLDRCVSDAQTTEDFFCDVEREQCLARCDFDDADDTRSSDCPLNSYCLIELTGVGAREFNGLCIPGDCDSNIFDDEACDGTGTCFPVGNGAS